MGIVVKETGSNIEPLPEGVHQAVCYAVYDIGTQYNETFKSSNRKLIIIWELPEERIVLEKNGEKVNLPRAASKKYSASLNEKANLRKDLQSWRGRVFSPEELQGFDITKLLGINCMLQIIHTSKDGKTYANISAVLPLYKGLTKKAPENPMRFFSLDDTKPIPEECPDWIKNLIMDSEEWKTYGADRKSDHVPPPDDDDIPF